MLSEDANFISMVWESVSQIMNMKRNTICRKWNTIGTFFARSEVTTKGLRDHTIECKLARPLRHYCLFDLISFGEKNHGLKSLDCSGCISGCAIKQCKNWNSFGSDWIITSWFVNSFLRMILYYSCFSYLELESINQSICMHWQFYLDLKRRKLEVPKAFHAGERKSPS